MKNQALIYHRPSKWPIAIALGTAVLIHLSAVAIAFHREPLITEPALSDSTFIPIDPTDDPPQSPPDPDIPIPPAPPPPTMDFIEPHETPRAITIDRIPAPIRRVGQTRPSAVGNAKAWVVSAPRPEYPYEARSRHLTGTGIAVIRVDSTTGMVVDAAMEQTIGNPILDSCAILAFRRWRFKPGTPPRVRIPITFMLTGAQY
jgi:TonB family protein